MPVLPVAFLVVVLGASIARGDVVTSLSGSTLTVTGDSSPNAVQIEQAPDGLTVTGLGGTLVDGSSRGVTIPGVTRLTVKLRQGADYLALRDVTLSSKLTLRMGRGNDEVVLDGVYAGATSIRTDDGYDFVSVLGPSRLKRLSVDTSNGEDSILLDGVWIPGDLDIDTGADDDDVTIVDTEVGDDVDVRLGNDDDVLVLADVSFDDDTELDGEEGDDALFFSGYVWFGDDLDIDGFGDGWWWWY